MRRLGFVIALITLHNSGGAEACGRCRIGHARHQRIIRQPLTVNYRAPIYQASAVASPQMTYTQPFINAQPTAARPTPASPPSEGGVQPLYNYAAAKRDQPAYYYTYDNSGKLVVSQWMDYLFRGGKAEGMPRPPLPLIGRLGNRD